MTPGIRRVPAVVSTALASMVLATACMSQPGSRTVVRDQIEALSLPAEDERCMLDKVEGYDKDELSTIAKANEDLNFDGGDSVDDGTEELQAFRDDFAECLDPDREASAPPESSVPGESTEPSESTESTEPETTDTTEG